MLRQNCNKISERERLLAELSQSNHVLLLVVDAIVAVHSAFGRWLSRRRTRRTLANLDDHQLRDIGLTRGTMYQSPSLGAANGIRTTAPWASLEMMNSTA